MNNKEKYMYSAYMRLLDLYDYLEVYPNDIDATLEVTALEVIYRLHKDEISTLEKGGVGNE